MSPPEVWGPAVWTLFHTLAEKLNNTAYNQVVPSMFGMIVQICKVLPCPECSRDASIFLAKIKLSDYKTKDEFKNMLYLFHNYVNAKKRKPLYNYANMNKYVDINLLSVINNFIAKYNTKGNMKLLAESFQRSFVIKNFITWFNAYKLAFIQPVIVNTPQSNAEEATNKEEVTPEISVEKPLPTIIEEPVIEESLPTIEECTTNSSSSDMVTSDDLITHVDIVEETTSNETMSDNIEKTIINEEPINIQPYKEEVIIKEPTKSKKNRKSKK